MIKTALCAYGMSGEVFHAPLIFANPNFQLSHILERTKNKSQEKYPQVNIARSFQELLKVKDLDLIVVNTPNQLHFPMAKEALIADKHVVIEKPFTLNYKQGLELINLAKEKNKVLSVFYNKRFEGDFLLIQQLINQNVLGEINYFEAHFDRYKPEIGLKKWKEEKIEGAGILWDLGPHLIDQALLLFGQPLEVNSDLRIERKGSKVVDAFDLDFIYPNKKVRLSAGMLVKNNTPKYILKGEKGTFIKWGVDPQEEQLKQGLNPHHSNWGLENNKQWGELNLKGSELKKLTIPKGFFQDYYQNIYSAITNQQELIVKAEQAIPTIKIIEGIINEDIPL